MKAQELMVGNWVYNSTINQKMQVYPMMIPQLHRIEKEKGSLKDCNIKPIPLTEEILLKCGFEKYGDFWYVLGDIKIEVTTRGYFRFSGYVRIYHLHQLQNLYFALTGEGLKIEL